MDEDVKTSIVRIYKRQNANAWPIGCGFLIGGRSVLTCRHVVEAALYNDKDLLGKEVELDFPFPQSSGILEAKVSHVVEKPDDIAMLQLLCDPPEKVIPMPLSTEKNFWGHTYHVFGIMDHRPDGTFCDGKLKSCQPDGTIQMENESQFNVFKGFSGAAVWDANIKRAVGMIVSIEAEPGRRVSYAIPIANILERYRDLKKLIADLQHTNQQEVLPLPEVLPEQGPLPIGSRLPFLRNGVFTGRREYLLDLAHILLYAHDGNSNPAHGVVITGMGGIGKTQLVIEFCYRYGRFFKGVHWIQANLGMETEIAENGLAMNLHPWPDRLTEQVRVTLRAWQEDGEKRLIVLDYIENPKALQDWMPKFGSARLMITSRREKWPEDMELEIKGLEVLSRNQSVELLRKLAIRLKDEPDEQLEKLAGYLGDLPLALDLASRYLADRSKHSIKDYLADLHKAGYALEHTSLKDWVEYNPTNHPTSLATTFTLSWQQLTDNEELAKRLFMMMGYCQPNTPIPREMLAKAIGQDVPDHELDKALLRLESLGLIDVTDEDNRMQDHRMHGLLAEFARLQERDAGESVLPLLAGAIVELTDEALESGLPEDMKPLREHLNAVVEAAEKSNLRARGALWCNLGRYLSDLADYEGAKKTLERALKIDETVYGPDHPNVARDLNSLGLALKDLGKSEEARSVLERALKIDETVYGPDHPNVARDLNSLGLALKDLGKSEEARSVLERALKIDETVYGPDHPNVARYVNNLGAILIDLEEWQKAKQCLERALEIDEKFYGPDHPKVAIRLNNLGGLLQDLGKFEEAKNLYERALKIDKDAYGPDHPNVAVITNNLGLVLQDLGEWQQAKQCLERALEIDEKFYGPDHYTVGNRVTNLGLLMRDLSDLDAAKKFQQRALDIGKKCYAPDHPRMAIISNHFGLVLHDLGEWQQAKQYFEKALKIDKDFYGPNHFNVARDLNNLGLVLKELGQSEEAKKNFESALKIDETVYGPDHHSIARDVNNLGLVLKDMGQLKEARNYCERALKIDETVYGPNHFKVGRDINNLGSILKEIGDTNQARQCFEKSLKILLEKLGKDHPLTKNVANNLHAINHG